MNPIIFRMDEKAVQRFITGGILFIVGLLALTQGSFDGALLFCGLGIVIMASADTEKTLAVIDLFTGGFAKLLKTIFPYLFSRTL